MIDAPDVLRDYLLTKTALTTLTGTRIWAELTYPPKGYKPDSGGAIAFKSAGGGWAAEDALQRTRWQLKCYGADVYQIRAVYRALMDIFHDIAGGGILSSNVEAPGTMLAEPETGWPFMLIYAETRMRSGLPMVYGG